MRLPYNKSFCGLKIVGLLTERCHPTTGGLARIYFRLSEPPPLGWAYIFTTVWRGMANPIKRQAGVEQDAIWIDCIPEEIAKIHQSQLEFATEQACVIYRSEAQKQMLNEAKEAQSHNQFRSEVEKLSQTLYPTTPQFSKGYSIITNWFWSIIGAWMRKGPSHSANRPVVQTSPDFMRDYHHSRFEGAAVSPDGRSVMLDYFDHDQGGTRYCFRYILSAHEPPRLVSGFTHENSNLDYEIPVERIPHHVLREAKSWLNTYLNEPHDHPIDQSLYDLTEFLKPANLET